MRKLLSIAIILSFLFVSLGEANAWFWDKKTKEETTPVQTKEKQPVVQEQKTTVDKQKKAEDELKTKQEKTQEEARKKEEAAKEEVRKAKRALVEQKRKEIDNIEWEIQLVPLSGKGNKLSE